MGQNLEHGLSVYVASYRGLLLVHHYLAKHGVPLEEAHKLNHDGIDITQVTVTYFIGPVDTAKDME